LNIIQIVSDTFRQDFLGCYGNKWIHTEKLDAFAKKSIVFDNAYIASFPTIPNRRDLFTGRYSYIYSGWYFNGEEPNLPRNEIILSQTLRQNGYTTMLIADTYHLFRDCHNFDRGFDGWEWIRGQEHDRYKTKPTRDSAEIKNLYNPKYLMNVSNRRYESEYFVAKTMTSAAKWLELNYNQHKKFFLHVDTFDPHEPWDPPRWYIEMYDPDCKIENIPSLAYAQKYEPDASKFSDDQLHHVKSIYAGEVTLVDRWIGMLLQKIEDLGLFEDTMVIFTSDHGTFLGEHGYVHKNDHLYKEVAKIPLIVRMPDNTNNIKDHIEALVQPPDLMPTILELANIKIPNTVQGKTLLPIIQDEKKHVRDIAVSSTSLLIKPQRITITSDEWSLIMINKNRKKRSLELGEEDLESELYHLPSDPKQSLNLIGDRREVAEMLHIKMVKFLKSLNTKEALLTPWKDTF
jgi:arylsulfatase A-like enzyme